MNGSPLLGVLASRVVIAGWIGLGVAFLLHRRRHRPAWRPSDFGSAVGLGLQGGGFALCWVFERAPLTPFEGAVAWAALLALLLVVAASVGLVWSTLGALGRHWSATADLEPDHRLITTGPFAHVRHPLYTAMLGLVTATAVVHARWLWVPAAVAMYVAGSLIRVRQEEAALARRHGPAWTRYRARVPALLPGLARRRPPSQP